MRHSSYGHSRAQGEVFPIVLITASKFFEIRKLRQSAVLKKRLSIGNDHLGLLQKRVNEKKHVWLLKRKRKMRQDVLVLDEWKRGCKKKRLRV